ncbi:MAG TPA: response regulator [Dictyobacter sp.]|jgi:CheY-like chemotaxis protein|nr:response regulator [Dictyobacter sp.]
MAHVGLLEDNMRIARLCAMMLQYAGHHVVIYEHPRDCLTALLPKKTKQAVLSAPQVSEHGSTLPVDVLILDLHLPDIPGLEVLQSLRNDPRTLDLPLIFCTAAASSEIANAMHIAPQSSFIEKPFTYQELIAVVSHVLRH